MNDLTAIFGAPIDVYTRALALRDGVLVAVPEEAQRKAKLSYPVAVTAAVHAECVSWESEDAEARGAMEEGRLAELLWMAHNAILRAAGGRRVGFEFGYVRADDPEAEKSARLVVACGPDDDGEPVLTVMFPHED
ncbi:DUF6573 family protein [Kitasatospora sp. NPDC093679]|uniref:DUF6573 family protein n=1 Tax=Kitasatospora sp. NPDC093679 TaxID=3154983 RepID=UPI0034400DE1